MSKNPWIARKKSRTLTISKSVSQDGLTSELLSRIHIAHIALTSLTMSTFSNKYSIGFAYSPTSFFDKHSSCEITTAKYNYTYRII